MTPPPPTPQPVSPPAADTAIPPGVDDVPPAVALPRRRRNLQLVWLVPAIAALIAVVLGIRAWVAAGPTITIQFPSAEGLEPGRTKIRLKNVDIGTVRAVTLTSDRNAVRVRAEMARSAGSMLVDDTRFWVVRPRFAGGELTGLSTLLSGAYIGVDVGKSDESRSDFVGLAEPPSLTTDEPGREFVLHSADAGSVDIGTPVYHRRIEVGKITSVGLEADGRGVRMRVFVRSPYEALVTTNTRFWHASGIDLSLDAGGVKVQSQSLVTVLLGGVAFANPDTALPAPRAEAETDFTLFADPTAAMKRSDSEIVPLLARFSGSMRGLSAGAPVDFRGIVVGEVKAVDNRFDPLGGETQAPVRLAIYRDRIRDGVAAATAAGGARDAPDAEALLRRAIERGLQAQLRIGNLLTGQRYVALDFADRRRPRAAPAEPVTTAGTLEIPTVPGGLEDLQSTLTQIAKSIEKVPFDRIAVDLQSALQSADAVLKKANGLPLEAIAGDVRTSLKSLDAVLANAERVLRDVDRQLVPEVGAAVADARRTMQQAQQLLAADGPTQQDLRGALLELQRAAQSLRELADLLQRHPQALIRGRPRDNPAAPLAAPR